MAKNITSIFIKKLSATDKEQWIGMGGGCYLVVAKAPTKSKRFVGKTKIGCPLKKQYSVKLGVWIKDFNSPQEVLDKWNDLKRWGKKNNKKLTDFSKKIKVTKTVKSFREVCNLFLEEKSKNVRDIKTPTNRVNQILKYLECELITDFAGSEGRGYLKEKVLNPKIASGAKYMAHRLRRTLNEIFNFALTEAHISAEDMPYRLDLPFTFETTIKTQERHKHLSWDVFCEDFLPKLSENKSTSGRLVNLAAKAALLSMARVSTVVSWRWDWYDKETNCWVVPKETKGLKRSREIVDIEKENDKGDFDHYIPNTPQLETLLFNNLYAINGNQEYVFFSPFKGKNPFISKSSPNSHLRKLGFDGRQVIHGFRHVAGTALGNEGFDRRMVGKCFSHQNKEGVIDRYVRSINLPQRIEIHERWNQLLIEKGLRI